ncbi:uncharacterized protein BO95DRAFT_464815 [Aspergillus brunneoviolaceus CBS 621.78]|uniref:Uncharacterized protein n=1 Tax=Aspergillus brunneoviolaceus CBS 621.78 TaxID=1450534 RepID=A0ACD1G5R9_9EURO|nr:hypothetical protein BO95DRAFT_464815 [Aspergillus brunneoviolaceus CBS 621.78]RAH44573.1 hypothetical protein BO95DRAFT_464815 [Aspergillus brunneoviolaceus CBS 621.78]
MAFVDPRQSTQPHQTVTTIIVTALAIFFVFLRLLARGRKRVRLGPDDYTLIVGLVFVIVIAAVNLACIHYGMGRHTSRIPPADLLIFSQLLYAFEPLYITTVGIIKVSVLLMYHRIFPVRLIRVAGILLATITVAWVISVDLVAIYQCTPLEKAYNTPLAGHCIDLKAALIGNGVPNFVTDICIPALPGQLIWKIHVGFSQRISILLVFLSGSLCVTRNSSLSAVDDLWNANTIPFSVSVVFASIYRFSLIFSFEINDIAWTLADAETWCVVETAAGVISACLPTVIPMIKHTCCGLGHSLPRTASSDGGVGAILPPER